MASTGDSIYTRTKTWFTSIVCQNTLLFENCDRPLLLPFIIILAALLATAAWNNIQRYRNANCTSRRDDKEKTVHSQPSWPVVEPLFDFHWDNTTPLQLRPFKPTYFLSMSICVLSFELSPCLTHGQVYSVAIHPRLSKLTIRISNVSYSAVRPWPNTLLRPSPPTRSLRQQ